MRPDVELRTLPRVSDGRPVTLAALPVDRRSRRYLEGVIADISLGGMFIASPVTFRPGTLLQFEFSISGNTPERLVRGRAVVRWRRCLRRPRGMGVRFVEFEGPGRTHLTEWLERALSETAR